MAPFAAALAKFAPKQKPNTIYVHNFMPDIVGWHVTEMENVRFDGCIVRPVDPNKPHSFTMQYITRNGYLTSPSQKNSDQLRMWRRNSQG